MKTLILLVVTLLTFADSPKAQSTELRKKQYNLSSSGLAIDGYDPVSYFTGKPVEGDKKFNVTSNGVVYYFANAANRDKFKSNPSAYEPQYGGWCAYAMGANGEKVEIDPETYKIINGKLFLFYNKFFNNTLKSWNKDEKNLHINADKNWEKIQR